MDWARNLALIFMQVRQLSPAEAREKWTRLNWILYLEQFRVSWYVEDIRPEVNVRNWLAAFWEGRVSGSPGWTTPLDNTKNWLVGQIRSIVETALRGLGWIADRARELVRGLLETACRVGGFIWSAVRGAVSFVWEKVVDVFSWLKSVAKTTWDAIGSATSLVWENMKGIFSMLFTLADYSFPILRLSVQLAYSGIIEAIALVDRHTADEIHAANQRVLSTLGFQMGEITSTASQIWEGIKEVFGKAVDVIKGIARWVWDNVLVPLGRALWSGVEFIFRGLAGVLEGIVNGIVSVAKSFAPTTPERGLDASAGIMRIAGASVIGLASMTLIGELCHPLKQLGLGHVAAMLYDMSGYKLIIGAFMGALTFCLIKQPVTYHFQRIFRPILPAKGDIIEAISRELLPEADAKVLMGYHGFSDDYYFIWEDLAKTPVKYFALRAVASTGYYNYDFFEDDMRRSGYPKPTRDVLHQMYQSLAAFEVKGIYASVALNRFRDGLISAEQLDGELKLLRTPEPLRHIYSTAAELMRDTETRTDAMRSVVSAYRKRRITHEQLAHELLELDIETSKIDQILQAERLIYPEDIHQTPQEEIRAYGRGTAIKRYKEGLIDDLDFRQEMALLGYTSVLIEQALVLARLERDFDYAFEWKRTADVAYATDVIGDEDYLGELRLAGFGADISRMYLEQNRLRKLPKIKREVTAS